MGILELIKKRVVIFDGGMGTSLALMGAGFKGGCGDKLVCSEAYNLYAPDVLRKVHQSFVDVGCDVIETNTFSANRISLAEHGLQDRVGEIVSKAVSIAREVAENAGRQVYVSGDLGPTNKLPSTGQVSFDEMYQAYVEELNVLMDVGVDLIQIDTCQDILQAKIAVVACNDVFRATGLCLPIIVTVTIDSSGKMLLGTEMDAVIATLLPLGVSAIGLNCGLGPHGMEETVRFLAHHSPLPVAILPNAGLPEIVGGKASYTLSPDDFAGRLEYFVRELGIEMIGGCCGTTPEHLVALVGSLKDKRPRKRKTSWQDSLSSLFSSTTIRQKPAPMIIGERMNINGSKKFREFILADDYDGAAMMAGEQESTGVHVIDVSVAYAGRDEIRDIVEVLKKVTSRATAPLCVDSTRFESIEPALKMIPGRPIINSINLEDGGDKARKILSLARRFGTALIALTIDESGMAKDVSQKCAIADRLIELAAEYEISESSLFIDPLTFTLAEPRAAAFGSGAKTLEAVDRIKKKHPSVNIILGISNISYGFKKGARRVLNSVFLHEAVKAGLDAAIIHAAEIAPIANLDKEMVEVSRDLIWNKKGDALDKFMKFFEGKRIEFEETPENLTPKEGVRLCILKGDKVKIVGFLDALVKSSDPKDILNDNLLPAMAEVGKLFDKGDIPLPFVLQSAEAMKIATDILAGYFGENAVAKKGKIVLATVRGDVHDIGKNLVDIVLTNNGFGVINIGVKQPVENILKAAVENNADLIGLSGLLVESALIMKDDLAELAKKGIKIPVICGGAALTRKFVEKELATVYGGPVFYAADAFDGLKIVEKVIKR